MWKETLLAAHRERRRFEFERVGKPWMPEQRILAPISLVSFCTRWPTRAQIDDCQPKVE